MAGWFSILVKGKSNEEKARIFQEREEVKREERQRLQEERSLQQDRNQRQERVNRFQREERKLRLERDCEDRNCLDESDRQRAERW